MTQLLEITFVTEFQPTFKQKVLEFHKFYLILWSKYRNSVIFKGFFGFCNGNSATFSKLFATEIPCRPLGGNGLKLEEPIMFIFLLLWLKVRSFLCCLTGCYVSRPCKTPSGMSPMCFILICSSFFHHCLILN